MTPNTHLRTTLARVLTTSINYPQPERILGRDLSKLIDAATDAVVAKGYFRPRLITTVEELDALPALTVIREYDGFTNVRQGLAWVLAIQPQTSERYSEDMEMPVTVLWEPTK